VPFKHVLIVFVSNYGFLRLSFTGLDMIYTNGGLIGAITNGGFAEYAAVPEKRVKIPDDMDWELAASLPVTSLTPYHALKETCLKLNEYLLVFGASGNTGMEKKDTANKPQCRTDRNAIIIIITYNS
jgi:threonine dehydrogenase-like Zn-dependent dehydrogenase